MWVLHAVCAAGRGGLGLLGCAVRGCCGVMCLWLCTTGSCARGLFRMCIVDRGIGYALWVGVCALGLGMRSGYCIRVLVVGVVGRRQKVCALGRGMRSEFGYALWVLHSGPCQWGRVSKA